jgi:hypothetical protein
MLIETLSAIGEYPEAGIPPLHGAARKMVKSTAQNTRNIFK